MDKFKFYQFRRRTKQLFVSLIFIAILIFGWQYPLLGFFIPFCMFLGMIIAFFRGRKWCDWYCPRGSFYDSLIKTMSGKKGIPALFRNIYFRLAVILFFMVIMGINLVLRWPDVPAIGLFFVIMMTITTILGIILAVIFHQRSWCMICPVGTIACLIGKYKRTLKINSEACIECKLCAKVCPVQIKPYTYKTKGIQLMKDPDCLKCGLCVNACPQKALEF